MSARSRKQTLEPVAAVFVVVMLGHVLIGLVLWTLLPLWPASSLKPVWSPVREVDRYWFSPADFKHEKAPVAPPVAAPKPVVAPSVVGKEMAGTLTDHSSLDAPVAATEPAPMRPASKIITLSPVPERSSDAVAQPQSSRPPITLMDVLKQEKRLEEEKKALGGGADMDAVLKALEEALKKEWNAPAIQQVPAAQRDVRLAVSIGRDGGILESRIAKSSGSAALDQSVKEAGERVRKISESLPSSFPKDRYNVEVNFHIE